MDIQDKNLDEMQDIFCKNKELGENSRNDYNVLVNHLNLLVNEKENVLFLFNFMKKSIFLDNEHFE